MGKEKGLQLKFWGPSAARSPSSILFFFPKCLTFPARGMIIIILSGTSTTRTAYEIFLIVSVEGNFRWQIGS
ncbi:hypothetical protein VTO42DRAFT_2828 [Malbranchea cinnamomea]